MAVADRKLGADVHQHLRACGCETPLVEGMEFANALPTMELAHSKIMYNLGLDLNDDSLAGTPRRVAKMYKDELFYGLDYANFPSVSTFENHAKYDEMLSVSCTVHSFCEHHFLPFIGVAHVAYIPKDKLLGLSKFNRIVDFFSRRPQVQERLTAQIATTFKYILNTEDIAVVIQAEHYCVKLRGIKDDCGHTTSSQMSGKFRDVPELRQEFLTLTRK